MPGPSVAYPLERLSHELKPLCHPESLSTSGFLMKPRRAASPRLPHHPTLNRERLQIGLKKWNVKQQLALFRGGQPQWDGSGVKEVGGRSSDLSRAGLVVAGYVNGQPQTQLVLQEGGR